MMRPDRRLKWVRSGGRSDSGLPDSSAIADTWGTRRLPTLGMPERSLAVAETPYPSAPSLAIHASRTLTFRRRGARGWSTPGGKVMSKTPRSPFGLISSTRHLYVDSSINSQCASRSAPPSPHTIWTKAIRISSPLVQYYSPIRTRASATPSFSAAVSTDPASSKASVSPLVRDRPGLREVADKSTLALESSSAASTDARHFHNEIADLNAMRGLPILFSAPMVRATLEDRKEATRPDCERMTCPRRLFTGPAASRWC